MAWLGLRAFGLPVFRLSVSGGDETGPRGPELSDPGYVDALAGRRRPVRLDPAELPVPEQRGRAAAVNPWA